MKKHISGATYLMTVLLATFNLENKEVFAITTGTIVPVLMIWVPEEVNNFTLGTGGIDGPVINKPTPAFLISVFGWLALLLCLLLSLAPLPK